MCPLAFGVGVDITIAMGLVYHLWRWELLFIFNGRRPSLPDDHFYTSYREGQWFYLSLSVGLWVLFIFKSRLDH